MWHSKLMATSMAFAPMHPLCKVMTSKTCMGWAHDWHLAEANVANTGECGCTQKCGRGYKFQSPPLLACN